MTHRTRLLPFCLTGLGLILMANCSSEEGGPNTVTPFGNNPDGNNNSAGSGNGSAGSGSDSTGNAGSTNDGSPNNEGNDIDNGVGGSANGNAGASSTGMAGSSMDTPIEDFVAEPGPGFFTSGEWRGYAWVDHEGPEAEAAGETTTIPADFTELPEGEPFCVSGSVAPDEGAGPPDFLGGFEGYAMMGFNIAQSGVAEVEGEEPEVGTIVPTGDGVAFTFSQAAGNLRLQIQGLDATQVTQRWCADVPPPDANGRAFVAYEDLLQECYLGADAGPSYQAAGRPPLAAVAFLVPGLAEEPLPYDFCIGGIADGSSVEDAPSPEDFNGGGLVAGQLSEQYGRARVRGTDGNLYIVQNNAWNSSGQAHRIQFEGNSFTVAEQRNSGDGQIPISFPSIFVGGHGNQGAANDFSTAETDGLPIRINEINSLPSTFFTNAGQLNGAFNATYDIWFHADPPVGEYNDAGAAYLMVWTHKPAQNPIGLQPSASNLTIPGAPGTWDLWVGPRNENGREQNLNGNAPVISYVSREGQPNFSADLMVFFNDAVQRSNNGTLQSFNGQQTFQFPATLTLTDIFAGFEIWNGGEGLRVSEFSVDVQ